MDDSDGLYRSIYNSSPAQLHMIDVKGRILSVSDAWLQAMGYERGEVLGHNLEEFVSEEARCGPARDFLTAVATGHWAMPIEIQLRRKNGDTVDVLASISPAGRCADGGESQVIVGLTDITGRKQAEKRQLCYLREQMEDANQELQRFAYAASHDLNEPLRMVTGFCGLLRERYQEKLDPDAKEFIGYAVDGAHRMQDLIGALLAYSRVHTRGQPLIPMDSEAALQRAMSQLQAEIRESGATILYDSLPKVVGDQDQISQLFQNLIGNAIKFRGSEAPRVHISAEPSGAGHVFRVKDSGIGIEEKHRERIFQVFQRLHTRDEYPGTGIGLAICSRIVNRHGGRLWVESTSGTGSTFCFVLPPVIEEIHG